MMLPAEQQQISSLDEVLRVSPEPYGYFTEQQVHRLLTDDPRDYFAYIKAAFHEIAHDRAAVELPPKQLFEDLPVGIGDFRVMPCVVRREGMVTKTVKVIGTNRQQQVVPDQITVGKAFALHPTDNFISHVFEACLLSSARTGLCASIAAELLAKPRPRCTIIGCGRVGYYAAFYIGACLGAERINFYDLDRARAESAAQALTESLPNLECLALETPFAAEADVIVLATTSPEALCAPADTTASLVISLGADTDNQHELDARWSGEAAIYVDTVDSSRFGDLRAWLNQGLIDTRRMTDFCQLLRGEAVARDNGRKIFVSTGSALFDNLTIAYILAKGVA